MDELIRLASKFYRLLLKMYPADFRTDFGEEMLEVFTLAISNAGKRGWLPAIGLIFQELAEFPVNLAREHVHEFVAEATFDRLISYRPRLFPVFIGILSFGSSFALLGLIHGLLGTGFLENLRLRAIVWLIARLLVGGVGGMSLGLVIDYQSRKRFALAGLLSYPGCLYVFGLISHSLMIVMSFDQSGFLQEILSLILIWLLSGVAAKLFLRHIQLRWSQIPALILAGAFGVLSGFFANRLVAALMQSYLRYPGWPGLPVIDRNVWYFLFEIVPGSLFGAALGAWLGLAAGQIRLKRLMGS